ncbi:MAG: ABC transporter ATP-binding protein [Ruminococcus sp.]|nr:ABC transporter ATP-binding protein [Ruminococcus sp.]
MKLKAEKICKKFNRKTSGASYFYAVNETDFELAESSLTAVYGRSGGGKTTFLNMLGGLLEPSGGRVLIDGTDIYSMPDKELSEFRNKNIGIIPQGSTALPTLTVLENVLLPRLMYGKSDDSARKYAMELLEKVGIAELSQAMPNELSGGELRRMAIARALMNKPSVLLADEPTGDLDDENTALVLSLLRDTAKEGTSVLIVTHEGEAISYADIVLKMDSGILKNKE